MRWSQHLAGFHGSSRFTTVSATCRFNPVPPASVLRNTLHHRVGLEAARVPPSGPSPAALAVQHDVADAGAYRAPSRLPSPSFPHCEKTTSLCSPTSSGSGTNSANSSSLGETRVCRSLHEEAVADRSQVDDAGEDALAVEISEITLLQEPGKRDALLLIRARAARDLPTSTNTVLSVRAGELREHFPRECVLAQEDRREFLADLVEVPITGEVALGVEDAMLVEELVNAGPNRLSSTNCTMLYNSSSRFSSGVPVSTIA